MEALTEPQRLRTLRREGMLDSPSTNEEQCLLGDIVDDLPQLRLFTRIKNEVSDEMLHE